MKKLNVLNCIALVLVVIGAIEWGIFGIFGWTVLMKLLSGAPTVIRVVYIVVGVAGLYTLAFMLLRGCCCKCKDECCGGGGSEPKKEEPVAQNEPESGEESAEMSSEEMNKMDEGTGEEEGSEGEGDE